MTAPIPETRLHFEKPGVLTKRRDVRILGVYEKGELITEVYNSKNNRLLDKMSHASCYDRSPASCQSDAVTSYINYMKLNGWRLVQSR